MARSVNSLRTSLEKAAFEYKTSEQDTITFQEALDVLVFHAFIAGAKYMLQEVKYTAQNIKRYTEGLYEIDGGIAINNIADSINELLKPYEDFKL